MNDTFADLPMLYAALLAAYKKTAAVVADGGPMLNQRWLEADRESGELVKRIKAVIKASQPGGGE